MSAINTKTPALEDLEPLVSLSRIDTLYRDRYLLRLRAALAERLPAEAYRACLRQRTTLDNLPNQIRNAMNDGDWSRVRDLSREHEHLKSELARMEALLEIGKVVYDDATIPIDPFSPGMNTIPGVARQSLSGLRDEARHALESLSKMDPEWRPFYRQRLESFERLKLVANASNGIHRPSLSQLESEALEALKGGNFNKLAHLADDLSSSPASSGAPEEGNVSGMAPTDPPPDYLFTFGPETVRAAQRLGLEALRVPSRHSELAPLCVFAWHPTFAQLQGDPAAPLRLPDIDFPQGTPEALKVRAQVFAAHPLINSAGIRFLPSLVGEDVLLETFDEPRPGSDPPASKLLELLGLPHRRQLRRHQIEAALLSRGSTILREELGLDPLAFRLVCIPPDLYLRVGLERGWGAEQLWTHFDGYMVMMDGALRALAGGDVRFGGVYDLLGVSRSYDSERIIARFAVVQRRRMARWT